MTHVLLILYSPTLLGQGSHALGQIGAGVSETLC